MAPLSNSRLFWFLSARRLPKESSEQDWVSGWGWAQVTISNFYSTAILGRRATSLNFICAAHVMYWGPARSALANQVHVRGSSNFIWTSESPNINVFPVNLQTGTKDILQVALCREETPFSFLILDHHPWLAHCLNQHPGTLLNYIILGRGWPINYYHPQ